MNDTARHNEAQIHYFTNRPLPRMVPASAGPTPYVQRQCHAAISACHIGPKDRVLDEGAVFVEPNPYYPGYYVQISLRPGTA